jgi:hypothetical protein
MIPPFDIFRTDKTGHVLWCERADALEEAEASAKALAERYHRDCIILSQKTGNNLRISPGPSDSSHCG